MFLERFRGTAITEGEQVIAPNLPAREFDADAPNHRDTTELRADGLRMYLAAVFDLYSRFVVGCSVALVNDRTWSSARCAWR